MGLLADRLPLSCFLTDLVHDGAHASKKHVSSRAVVITLLICVVLTTLAFLASLTCYMYRKDKSLIQQPVFSSTDKVSSCNSATNLISYKSSSFSETVFSIGSRINPISGCFHRASSLYSNKTGAIHGSVVQFSYSELEYATQKFSNSNLIGVGGSSFVYRGQLKDGRNVAVKRLTILGGSDADSVFLTEVELLAKLHHYHVVPLLGYCSEFKGKHAERLLVFEYMRNGNLRDCLDGKSGEKMNWETRVAIALGVARGLEYLHEAAAPKILHNDIKSSNILLDDSWRAKITDLGMAKCVKADGLPSCSNSPDRMQGTFGYFAPEYAIIGRASLMSDVFSFGVVLLELITGRQPIHKSINKADESLVLWATPRLQDSKRVISELPDPCLKGSFSEEDMQIMAYLAKECLLMDPDARPTMSEVVQILSTIAPDRSKRRYIPVNLFQMSNASRSMRDDLFDTRRESTLIDVDELRRAASIRLPTEELKKVTSERHSARCSPPVSNDHGLSGETHCKEADIVSYEYMERLILLTSEAKSSCALDDETVDLTEPRFESFVADVSLPDRQYNDISETTIGR
ncbi:hypothetical protein ACFE04_012995 [Oxalis oulophora]